MLRLNKRRHEGIVMTFLHRRHILHAAAGAVCLASGSRLASADSYPSRAARIIVGTPAGGSPDIQARLIGQWLSERLRQPFIVENRPGGGTNIATDAVVRAPADGYTLLLVTAINTWNASLYEKLNFDFIRDIAPVAGLNRQTFVMMIAPSFPASTVPEFIAYAKANPGKLNMASAGNATAGHVVGELFKMMAGVNMLHVPYRGAPLAQTALMTGESQVFFDPIPSSIEQIKGGKLRALAVTSAKPAEALPDLPPMGEFLPGFEANGWQGIGVPKATPAEIIDKLNKEINTALADPGMQEKIAKIGATIFATTPTEFGALIASDTEKWAKVVKFAGLKAD
jgi:tripartite-type tricarboxylate transporter receptor subunit TctC